MKNTTERWPGCDIVFLACEEQIEAHAVQSSSAKGIDTEMSAFEKSGTVEGGTGCKQPKLLQVLEADFHAVVSIERASMQANLIVFPRRGLKEPSAPGHEMEAIGTSTWSLTTR